ncbi:TPA: ASCH domain-containing protein [Vibrio parahaemolyticus]|uniref:ASCH domain-containing protein n=1 Tax=Vibrio parahaemolyticus TaxID=670 RepID=UPI001A305D95|nr:ASCH domain-containing protein [Vibrio parahaemolyticus]EGQ8181628.1 ASCH domain-containing protein [Vibrio parahaemolyticus]MCI9725966.1 ASCH domain-containing protein [Vibrio parahaemolyticus]MCZ6395392.1 ASCH domain-containing protein [Vibrio parahaemolyticus]MDZ5121316.1 ASCH domain-containing protein [Vibrio parahaemolyticus]HAS6609460.1 ASCH domain-containing protein [Vibrio parahaemolyticus]
MDERSQTYLSEYLNSLPSETAKNYTSFSADYFCADEYNANVCADLILRGEKRASCSLEYWYSQKGEPMPEVGHLQVVTNWEGKPTCIIELTSVSKCKYCDVTAEFAAKEGEGDKSLSWWRKAHWKFFSLECDELGIKPTEDMLLVLECFKVVYK